MHADKKQRWLYAAGVTAVRDMTPEALNQQPPNTTPSPFAPPHFLHARPGRVRVQRGAQRCAVHTREMC